VRNMMNANPMFVNPPAVSDSIPTQPGTGWFWDALNPRQLGNMLELQAGSPAINAGIDPATLTSDPNIRSVLQQYTSQDIKGVARPQGAAFDLGAYEYRSGSGGSTPTPIATLTNTPIPARTNTPVPPRTNSPVATRT